MGGIKTNDVNDNVDMLYIVQCWKNSFFKLLNRLLMRIVTTILLPLFACLFTLIRTLATNQLWIYYLFPTYFCVPLSDSVVDAFFLLIPGISNESIPRFHDVMEFSTSNLEQVGRFVLRDLFTWDSNRLIKQKRHHLRNFPHKFRRNFATSNSIFHV